METSNTTAAALKIDASMSRSTHARSPRQYAAKAANAEMTDALCDKIETAILS